MAVSESDLLEIDRNIKKCRNAAEAFTKARTSMDMRDAWEDFLSYFSRSIGRLISAGKTNKSSKAWAHILKNSSAKDDPGLVYLREARNKSEHSLEPVSDYVDRSVSIPGILQVSGNSSVTMTGNTIGGKPMGDFHLKIDDGEITSISGEPKINIVQMQAKTKLLRIRNDENGTTVFPPSSLLGIELEHQNPSHLATVALQQLDRLRLEIGDFE